MSYSRLRDHHLDITQKRGRPTVTRIVWIKDGLVNVSAVMGASQPGKRGESIALYNPTRSCDIMIKPISTSSADLSLILKGGTSNFHSSSYPLFDDLRATPLCSLLVGSWKELFSPSCFTKRDWVPWLMLYFWKTGWFRRVAAMKPPQLRTISRWRYTEMLNALNRQTFMTTSSFGRILFGSSASVHVLLKVNAHLKKKVNQTLLSFGFRWRHTEGVLQSTYVTYVSVRFARFIYYLLFIFRNEICIENRNGCHSARNDVDRNSRGT